LRDLRRVHLVRERQHAASRAHLDDVRAVLHLEADGVPEGVGPGGDAVRDAGLGPEELVGIAAVVAMAAPRAQGVHGHEHARAPAGTTSPLPPALIAPPSTTTMPSRKAASPRPSKRRAALRTTTPAGASAAAAAAGVTRVSAAIAIARTTGGMTRNGTTSIAP